MSLRTERVSPHVLTISLLLLGVVYVGLAWTPSSYALLLGRLGFPDTGLVAGEPREVREDEWVRWTPYVQAAVNNEFRRINETSVYREDLRSVEGLPLADWALVFKPYYWPFFLVDAAYAFSFYHAFVIAFFLIGYERLFRAFGSPTGQAAFGSVALFFSSFAQTWWTTYGAVLAGFPWLMLMILAPIRPWLKAIAVTYVTTSWLLANFYPPIMITLAFVGFLTLVAFRREALRPANLAACGLGLAAGCALVVVYFGDTFLAMANTVYPGRRVGGGGGEPVVQWLGHLLPFALMSGYRNLINVNICEASTVGTYLPLALLFFVERRGFMARLRSPGPGGRPWGWPLAVLAVGVGLTSLWMFVRLPPAAGVLLLWDRVPPHRMWFACGLLVLLLSLTVVRMAPLRLGLVRLAGFAAAVVGGWVVSERVFGATNPFENAGDTWILLPLAAVFALRRRLGGGLATALVGSAALANALTFGSFNPIQSAWPIFARPESPVQEALDRLADRHPEGWLVLLEGYGTWLNGWGYKSASHALYAPQLDFFRSLLPRIPQGPFNNLFNRTSYIKVGPSDLVQIADCCVLTVPIQAFAAPTVSVDLESGAIGDSPVGGLVESRVGHWNPGHSSVLLKGWGMFDGSRAESRLRVHTDLPVRRAVAYPYLRPDVARVAGDPELVLSGFVLRLLLEDTANRPGAGRGGAAPSGGAGESAGPTLSRAALRRAVRHPICVASEDPTRGSFLLRSRDGLGCKSAMEHAR